MKNKNTVYKAGEFLVKQRYFLFLPHEYQLTYPTKAYPCMEQQLFVD